MVMGRVSGSSGSQRDLKGVSAARVRALLKERGVPIRRSRFPVSLRSLSETQRLRFAGRVLAVLAILAVAGGSAHVFLDNGATAAIFEFVKIGLLPLAVLIVSFYFPKEGSN